MPAQTFGSVRPAIRSALDQRRRSERRTCNIAVTIRTGGGDFAARLLDLSAGGFGARIETLLPLRPGAQLMLIHPQLGQVPCQLRWAIHPRYGAEFHAGEQARARIETLYDGLAPGPGEIA